MSLILIWAKPTHILWVAVSVFVCELAAGGRCEAFCMVREVQDLLIHLMTSRWIPVDIHTPNPLRLWHHTTCCTSKSGRWWVCIQTAGWTSGSVEQSHLLCFQHQQKHFLKKGQEEGVKKFNLRLEACTGPHCCHPILGNATEDPSHPGHNLLQRLPSGSNSNSSIINSHLNKQFY